VTLELAPPGDGSSTSLAHDHHRWRFLSRKRLWLGLITATAAGAAAGFHWWTTIARTLGINAE
jgi:hypothetical protein